MTCLGLARGTVRLLAYSPEWKELFEKEAALLRFLMGSAIQKVEHIGSTSITGMSAKPIIDLVAVVQSLNEARVWITALHSLGYEYRPNDTVADRIFFAKGPRISRTHHLSLTEITSNFYTEKILFRDYLRCHRDAFAEYLTLKRELALQYPNDRESYTAGKRAFVERIIRSARMHSSTVAGESEIANS